MNLPAIPESETFGLEDFGMSDVALPRINIIGSEGVFENPLSGEKFDELNCVIVGLVRQRILWPAELGDEKSAPMCQSLDFINGKPNQVTFPWSAAGLKPAKSPTIACESCKLKEWETHPQGRRPWCAENWHVVLMNIESDGGLSPAIWTVRGAGLTPARNYISSFVARQKPIFTAVTSVTLESRKKGSNRYAVPKFAKGVATDESLYPVFMDTYTASRAYLQADRSEASESPVTVTASKVSDDTTLDDF